MSRNGDRITKISPTGRWVGYAACVCASLSAAISFYWGIGGDVGLELVGDGAVEASESGGLGIFVLLVLVGLVKGLGGLLALALVQPWGPRILPRWMLLVAGWGGAMLLFVYGGAMIVLQLLVLEGVLEEPKDMSGFYGHLYLWFPWFLLWGMLLGVTTLYYSRATRRAGRVTRR
jgi:hypothetical protein